MSATKVELNPGWLSMRALTLALFHQMQWRHHGIGVLQGYVAENVEPEVRIHVWSRRLLKPGMDESGDVHDHRFDLVSHVLAGAVGHEEITAERGRGGWAMMNLTHARAAKENAYHGPTEPIPGEFSVTRLPLLIRERWSYRFPGGLFHRSPLPLTDDVAVTLVEKHNQSAAKARILYPVDRTSRDGLRARHGLGGHRPRLATSPPRSRQPAPGTW